MAHSGAHAAAGHLAAGRRGRAGGHARVPPQDEAPRVRGERADCHGAPAGADGAGPRADHGMTKPGDVPIHSNQKAQTV